jgi:hypothetical protein
MNAVHPVAPEDLMAYLDGEVSGAAERDIHAHLAGCDACQQLAADLRDGSGQLREWQIEEVPSSLVAPEMQHRQMVQRERWTSLRWRPWRIVAARPFVAGAAAVAAAVVIASAVALQLGSKQTISMGSSIAMSDPIADSLAPAERLALQGQNGAQGQQGQFERVGSNRTDPERETPGPHIVRTATLRIVAGEFNRIRPEVDRILKGAGGFVGEITGADRPGTPRSIRGTLRIPSAHFDAALVELRRLGRVTEDSQTTEDVTATVVDLDVRLANARVTEKRLSEVLRNRTGGVADVLEVEREIARVRTEIEQFEAQRKQLDRRLQYATLRLEIVEELAASVNLGPVPIPTRLRHAIADGVQSAMRGLLESTLFMLRVAPAMLLWVTLFGLPAWWIVRRYVLQRPGGV